MATIHERVEEECDKFNQDVQIEVSKKTILLISEIISAIHEDPHPRWNIQKGHQTELVIDTYISSLRMTLHQVVISEKVKNRVTSFDFLHWFTKSFGPLMCIIPKS